MKRILASILATSMALSLVAMPISATEQVNGSDFTTSAVEFVTEQQVDSDFSATLEEDFSQVEILDAGTFLAMAEDLQEIQQETLHVSQYQAGYFEYKEIISPQYQDGGMFSVNDGLAPVKLNGKWGYINTDNQVIVPFNYDFAAIFNEGHAIVGTTASGGYAMGHGGYHRSLYSYFEGRWLCFGGRQFLHQCTFYHFSQWIVYSNEIYLWWYHLWCHCG